MTSNGSLIKRKKQTNDFLALAINCPNTWDELPVQPHKRWLSPVVSFFCILYEWIVFSQPGPGLLSAGVGSLVTGNTLHYLKGVSLTKCTEVVVVGGTHRHVERESHSEPQWLSSRSSQSPHKALEGAIEIWLCKPTWLMGRTREGLEGLLFPFFLFFFLSPPTSPTDGIKKKPWVRLSQPGDFLRVLCVVLFEKRQNPQTKHSCVNTKVQLHGWNLPFHSQRRVSQMNPGSFVQTMGSPGSCTWSDQWARGQSGQWEGTLSWFLWPPPRSVNRAGVFYFQLMSLVFKRDPKCPTDQDMGHVHVISPDVTLCLLSCLHPLRDCHPGTQHRSCARAQ